VLPYSQPESVTDYFNRSHRFYSLITDQFVIQSTAVDLLCVFE